MKKDDIIIIPTGRAFLPNTGAACLKRIQKAEKDPKARMRLLAYIMRKQGFSSIRQTGQALNRPYSTIRHWLMRAMQMGIMGRYDEKRPSAIPKLDAAQMAQQLRADLVAGPYKCGFESGTVDCNISKSFRLVI